MKKITILLAFAAMFTTAAVAQSTVGLVAHWDFNGTTNDVSGNGHNGHGNNITPAVGIDGVAGHGYYFNGTNSWVSVPYSPSFNVNGYSICAKVFVQGFYSGTCHANMLFVRGNTGLGNCVYMLQFADAPAGIGCSSGVDTTQQVFWTGASAPSATLSPSSISTFNYTPKIVSGRWYTVVATFNDTVYKVYVDNVLKSTAYITNPGLPMGSGTDSISIGYAIKEAASGYPYPFKGIIDDMKLFNRALTDSEVVRYGDSCGSITMQPRDTITRSGLTATFSVTTTIAAANYQWQQDAGTGFTNLTNAGPYSGVNTNTLRITGVSGALYTYKYRCLVNNINGCSSVTDTVMLVVPSSISELNTTDYIGFHPNPANSFIEISSHSNLHFPCNFYLYNAVGQLVVSQQLNNASERIQMQSLPSGVYIGKVETDQNVYTERIIKN